LLNCTSHIFNKMILGHLFHFLNSIYDLNDMTPHSWLLVVSPSADAELNLQKDKTLTATTLGAVGGITSVRGHPEGKDCTARRWGSNLNLTIREGREVGAWRLRTGAHSALWSSDPGGLTRCLSGRWEFHRKRKEFHHWQVCRDECVNRAGFGNCWRVYEAPDLGPFEQYCCKF